LVELVEPLLVFSQFVTVVLCVICWMYSLRHGH
jgi:hypothetical protein